MFLTLVYAQQPFFSSRATENLKTTAPELSPAAWDSDQGVPNTESVTHTPPGKDAGWPGSGKAPLPSPPQVAWTAAKQT